MPIKKPKPVVSSAVPVHPKGSSPAWHSNLEVLGSIILGASLLLWLGLRLFRKKPVQSACTPAPLPDDMRLGDYLIDSVMANGGTATVYRGEDDGANPVAIKIPHAEQIGNREFSATFLREAQIGLELRHPSIVRVLHAGSYSKKDFRQIPYFVMEFLDGQELAEMIHRHGVMEPQFAVMVARSVADALQWAHARGVVHRDISPANIYITSKRLVKVMDFGISTVSARFTGRRQSKALSFGTPSYLAPERSIDSRSCDARSDLYSLGCVMFEMITGHPPYVDEKPEVIIKMHRKSPIPSLQENTESIIPPELEGVLTKLLAKNPAQRYQTAGEVVSALAELIEEK